MMAAAELGHAGQSAKIDGGREATLRAPGLFLFTVCMVVGWTCAVPVASAQDIVATLESEFLERFTRFIEWPSDSSVADASAPFVICVADRKPVVDALGRIAEKSKIKGKRLEVREINSANRTSACNVVFVGPGDQNEFLSIVDAVARKPVLVVSDSRGYAKKGSMINFVTKGEFVRFEVNPRAAETSGLKFAPELLALGEVVD
jgi:hypothetical protein